MNVPAALPNTAGVRHRSEFGLGATIAARPMSPAEKAAIIITALGPQEAAPILKQLGEDEVRAFARASAQLGEIPRKMLEQTINEFMRGLEDRRLSLNSDKLKEILSSILSDDAIERILEDLDEGDSRSIWEKLSNSDPVDLSGFLAREHPQTAAVVVSRIKPDTAAKVMQRLEKEFAEEVILRLAGVTSLSSQVMDAVKNSIEGDFLRGARLQKSKRKPDELIGSIFNFMAGEKRDELMAGLEEKNATLAQAVQRKMFTFGDIPARVDRANITLIVREVERDDLVKAMAFAKKNAPDAKAFFLENMSRRLAEQFEEQIDEMPVPNTREGEEAQFAVIGAIRKMQEQGVLELLQPEDEEAEGDF